MLRASVVALLLANLAFWAWSTGALESLGWAPARERDPTRLEQQVRPDAVRVLSPTAATAALQAARPASAPGNAAARSPLLCLEAGPFAPGAIEVAEHALAAAALPEGSWVRTNRNLAASYAVVLGPFGNRDALRKKREEISRLRLPFEALDLPGDGAGAAPQPGFALGRYDSRDAAEAALTAFNQRGVRTARVALLRPASSESRLRVEYATPAQAEQLRALSGGAFGAGFAACATLAQAAPAR